MTSAATAVAVLAVLLVCGCAAHPPRSNQAQTPASEQALRLASGETVRLVPTSIADPPDGIVVRIDSAGDVSPLLGVKVHVAGLTLTEAAAAIQRAYEPKHFVHWDFTVVRVQPKD